MLGTHLLYVRNFLKCFPCITPVEICVPITFFFFLLVQKNKPRLHKVKEFDKGHVRVHIKNNKHSVLFQIPDSVIKLS